MTRTAARAGADGVRPVPPRLRPISSSVFVGRDGELDLLLRAAANPPAIAVVEGEAGVGKSRLVAELMARPEISRRHRLIGACHPLREPFLLAPFVEAVGTLSVPPARTALSPLTGALRPLLPELADRLPPAPELSGDPRAERHVLFRAVRELLAGLGPAICVLEDLHWADDTTTELLRFLVTQMPADLTLALTYRGEDVPASSALRLVGARLPPGVTGTRMVLSPLGVDDVGRLAAVILGAAEVSADLAALLHERTGGIPFAVEEVVRLLQDQRDVAERRGADAGSALDGLRVPAAIRDFVLERVGRLAADARRVVHAAAVLGVAAGEEPLAAVAEVGPRERTAAALADALEAHVLREVEPERYGLRHVLARQAVYAAISGPERRRLHLLAAHALRAVEPVPVAQVAHHFREAGMTAEWLRWAEAAAGLATSVRDHDTAARLLRDALTTPEATGPLRGRLAIQLAQASLSSATPPATSLPLVRTAIDEGLPPGVRGEVRAMLGLLLVAAGDASAGYAEQARAVEELHGRPDVAARVMLNLAAPWAMEGSEEDHLRWLGRATELATGQDDASIALSVRVARALMLLYVGDPAGWAAVDDIPWHIRSGDRGRELLWGAANLVGACIHLGHYTHARGFLEDAARRAEEIGWGQLLHTPEASTLVFDWAEGRWDGLEERARRHAEAMAAFPGWSVHSDLIGGSIALARGDTAAAERRLRASWEAARAAGVIPGLAAAGGGLARLLLGRADAEGARRAASAGLEAPAAKGIWVWAAEAAPAAVEAMIACGRLEDARDLTGRFAHGLAGRDGPLATAALHLCRGLVAEADGLDAGAVEAFGLAEEGFAALPRAYDAARAAVRSGVGLLRNGERRGGEPLTRALTCFESLGATADAARTRQVLRRHAVPVPRPRGAGRRAYAGQLSPREAEVVELAARGRTDVEIGQALSISPRTVAHHVSSAMGKLGVRSRRALIERRLAGLAAQVPTEPARG